MKSYMLSVVCLLLVMVSGCGPSVDAEAAHRAGALSVVEYHASLADKNQVTRVTVKDSGISAWLVLDIKDKYGFETTVEFPLDLSARDR